MNNIFKWIKKIYIKLFFLKPKLLSTIIFIPCLYIIGWVLATPIIFLGVNKESISLIGTIFTFLILSVIACQKPNDTFNLNQNI